MKAKTLAEFSIADFPRCSSCRNELSQKARIEECQTVAGGWIVAECPRCGSWTPFQLDRRIG